MGAFVVCATGRTRAGAAVTTGAVAGRDIEVGAACFAGRSGTRTIGAVGRGAGGVAGVELAAMTVLCAGLMRGAGFASGAAGDPSRRSRWKNDRLRLGSSVVKVLTTTPLGAECARASTNSCVREAAADSRSTREASALNFRREVSH